MRRATTLACLLALSTSWVPSDARAHLGHIVVSAERYLKIDASEDDTRVVVSLTLGEAEGRRVLEAADADHDGEVTQTEADAYLGEWARGLETELPVLVDGQRVDVAFGEPFLDPIGRVRSVAVTVEMVAHVPVTTREASLTLRDAMVRRETYDRTEVAFRAHDGAEVIVAGAGEAPTARELDLAFGRSLAPMPDAITMRALYTSREDARPFPWPLVGVVAAAALGTGVFIRRRTRR